MNIKKFVAVTAVSSALIMGTGIVASSAETGSTAHPTISATPRVKHTPLTDAEKAAKQAAPAKFRADLAAWQVLKDAYEAKAKPIQDAYKAAVAAAKATRDAALAGITPALPPRPTNPNGEGAGKGNN
jgi:hypothetical protein